MSDLALRAEDARDDVDAAEVIVVVEEFVAAPFRGEGLVADANVFSNDRARDFVAGEREVGGAGAAALFHPGAGVVVEHVGRAARRRSPCCRWRRSCSSCRSKY